MKQVALLFALAFAATGCGTFQSLVEAKPEIAKPAENVLAFAKCADVAGPALIEHLTKSRVLTAAEKAQLVIETMQCALVTADELYVEKARESTGAPATAVSVVLPNPYATVPQ